MKQIELELKKRLLIVEVGDIEEIIDVQPDFNTALLEGKKFIAVKDNHKLICKGSELTEDIAQELVHNLYSEDESCIMYRDYKAKYDDEVVYTALESFISAIDTQGYYWGKNPRGETIPMAFEKDTLCRQLWQVAESKTFNPEKTLIFEIL